MKDIGAVILKTTVKARGENKQFVLSKDNNIRIF